MKIYRYIQNKNAVLYLKWHSVISILRVKLSKCNISVALLDQRESEVPFLNIVYVYVTE
jgi:hypothetical protein